VADTHPWARAARKGDAHYRKFFLEDATFSGKAWPGVLDIFPEFAPGHWDWVPELETYFWATFYARQPSHLEPPRNHFSQWDLNYRNPEVLLEMCATLLQLANQGVDCLRLDAVLFLWKQKNTRCASLPELHLILQIFRAILDSAAPSVALLAEANDDFPQLLPYFGKGKAAGGEMQLCYGFPLLAFLWYAIEFGDAEPLRRSLEKCPRIPEGCSWLLFDEVHDEVTLEIVEKVLPDGTGARVRRKLFERLTKVGRGLPFRFQPDVDPVGLGISGTRWSLLGGEQAEALGDAEAQERAFQRIRLLLSFEFAMAGVPLIYSGSELGARPNWDFSRDKEKAADSRFLKRVPLTAEMLMDLKREGSREEKIHSQVRHFLSIRASHPAFEGNHWELLKTTPTCPCLGIRRPHLDGDLLIWWNFSDQPTTLKWEDLGVPPEVALNDILTGETWFSPPSQGVEMAPRSSRWLCPRATP
jgi:amylosucrase